MRSVQKNLRIPIETVRSIEKLAEAEERDFSRTTNELLEEAIRMRRCPGIVFTAGPAGRRATIAGSGIDVFEVVAKSRAVRGNLQRLGRYYHWLAETHLRAALDYYRLYPAEVDARLRREARLTPGAVYARHPRLEPSEPAKPRARRGRR
jgi:uncharacterized protein (DUF433 family)